MKLKVMTFNMHHGRGMDGKLNLERIAEMIEDNGPELVGLNEVDRCFSRRSDYVDQAGWLAERLGMNHVFGATLNLRWKKGALERQYGNALLSRYPIVSADNIPMDFYVTIIEGRAFLETEILVHDLPVKVCVTHLSLSPFLHRKQTEFIQSRIASSRQPMIVMGDMNMRPGTRKWRQMTGQITDVCFSAGKSPCCTFPSFRPIVQLDYVFASSTIGIDAVEAVRTTPFASDHLPLLATLSLTKK